MSTLIRVAIVLIAVHVGAGGTQAVTNYYVADDMNVSRNIFDHTPLGEVIPNLEQDGELSSDQIQSPELLNVARLLDVFTWVNNIVDMVVGLFGFNYGWVVTLAADDGVFGNLTYVLRIIAIISQLAVGGYCIKLLFDSGILTSKLGLAVMGGTAVVTTVSRALGE